MKDEEFVMKEDIRERKQMAIGAKHMNRRGKGPINMGVEYKSDKEINEMHGEVKTWELSKPLDYKTFKQMPDDVQGEYLRRLYDNYAPTDSQMAGWWKVNLETIRFLRRQHKIVVKTGHGRADSVEFNRWIAGEEQVKEDNIELRPMLWAEFKKLTKEEVVRYLAKLDGMFGPVASSELGKMFHISGTMVTRTFRELGIARPKSNGNKVLYDREAFNAWAEIDQHETQTVVKTPSGEVYTQDPDKQGWTMEAKPDTVEPFYAETEPLPHAFVGHAQAKVSDAFFRVTGTPWEIYVLLQSITGGEQRTYEINLMGEAKA